ncbi:hypothetical protein TNCV_3638671 [Trichonephila clavipes]|nr:hypothetical protein TNCV_3638671 [Trichonephila clavipes]
MGQYDEDKCTLPMCVHHNGAKHGCNHLDAVSRMQIGLQAEWHLIIHAPRFVVNYTIKDALVCGAASMVPSAIVSELRVYTVANIVELFVQTFVVLQTTPILGSVLVT